MLREKAQSVTTARPKVPMRRLGAHCLVVAMKRGNARGAKGVGHQRWIGSTGVGSTGSGRNRIINGRRQPSHGGTSRMMREYHVRICEGLGVQLPGSTRHLRRLSGCPVMSAPQCSSCFKSLARAVRARSTAGPSHSSDAAERSRSGAKRKSPISPGMVLMILSTHALRVLAAVFPCMRA